MSERLKNCFEKKSGSLLSVYFTAGYPTDADVLELLCAVEDAGVGFVELGFPFSDPIADGPVIQAANAAAIETGMTLSRLFEQLENLRSRVSIPVVLMGSFNPVLHYGCAEFSAACKEIGIDGVLLPDLPLEAYLHDFHEDFERSGISNVFLVTPQTPDDRISRLAKHTNDFLYLVSRSATTGTKQEVKSDTEAYVARVRKQAGGVPLALGFGISDRKTFREATKLADAAIVGTAFVKALEGSEGTVYKRAKDFVRSLLDDSK